MRRGHRRAAKGRATTPLRRILGFVRARIARRRAQRRPSPPAPRRRTAGSAGAAPPAHGALTHWLHHLFSAWAITGGVYLATYWGLTSFIDTSFLALVQAVAPVKSVSDAPKPWVVEFGAAQYQDRAAFAAWLEKAIGRKPRLVAIDIDLSPLSVPQAGDGQARLDAAIDGAGAKDVDIALVAPLEAQDEAGAAWIRRRCDPRVHVASPHLRKQFGWLLRYQPTFPSLGAVAADFLRKSDPMAPEGPSRICPEDKSAPLDIGATEALLAHSDDGQWQGIDFRQTLQFRSPEAAVETGDVVFVGGRESRDRIRTPVGMLPPVEAHAFIAGTKWREMPHGLAYALEVALGVLSGAAFQALWRRRDAARERHRAGVLASHKAAVWLPHLAHAALLALLFVLVALLLVAAFVGLSIEEIRFGTWLNPAPLVLGMALDSFLSHEREQRAVAASAGAPPLWWRHFLARPLAWFALLLILGSMAHLCAHLF